MDQVIDTLQDWRYPCGVVFLAPFIGRLIYRMIPAPVDAVDHMREMERAARAQVSAVRAGLQQMDGVANAFGMSMSAGLMLTLLRQRRKCLVGAYVLTSLLMIPLFIFLPVEVVPNWVFGAIALVGVYFTLSLIGIDLSVYDCIPKRKIPSDRPNIDFRESTDQPPEENSLHEILGLIRVFPEESKQLRREFGEGMGLVQELLRQIHKVAHESHRMRHELSETMDRTRGLIRESRVVAEETDHLRQELGEGMGQSHELFLQIRKLAQEIDRMRHELSETMDRTRELNRDSLKVAEETNHLCRDLGQGMGHANELHSLIREVAEETNRLRHELHEASDRAEARNDRSSPPHIPAEQSMGRPAAPRAPVPPLPPATTPPPAARPAPEPEIIRRHTNVDFPERVCEGKAHDLRVQFVPAEMVLPSGEVVPTSKPHAHDVTMPLRVPEPVKSGDRPPPIRVTVAVATENFEIDGPTVAEIIVPLAGKSSIAVFPLIGTGVGSGRIMVDFSQDNHPVGSIDLLPEIVAFDQPESTAPAQGEGEVNLATEPGSPIDVQITVYRHRYSGSEGQLQFILSSDNARLQDLPVFQGEVGRLDLNSSVRTFVETQLQPLAMLAKDGEATEEQVEKTLRNVGCNLYEQLIPKELKELYWTFRERGVHSLMIVSDDPYIPWELLRAFRTEPYVEDDRFWGEAFAMTHWLRPKPPSRQLSLGRIVAMAPGAGQTKPAAQAKQTRDIEIVESASVSQSQPVSPSSSIPEHPSQVLPSAVEEIKMIRGLEGISGSRVSVLAGYKSDLENAFEGGNFDLLHLACHGDFGGTEAGNASAVRMEDGPFTAAELSPRIADNMQLTRPLIFFNGCQTGRIGFVLTDLGSWGARLVELGCGAFVGTLWLVRDESAVAFATAFYAHLSRGFPIGESLQQSRQVVRERFPNDPTWLAYCCFANPLARTAATTDFSQN